MATYVISAKSATTDTVMWQYTANGRLEYLTEADAAARGAEWLAILNNEADPKDWSLVVEQVV